MNDIMLFQLVLSELLDYLQVVLYIIGRYYATLKYKSSTFWV